MCSVWSRARHSIERSRVRRGEAQRTFAYLADVFVVTQWRGRGISKRLVADVLAHPRLGNLSFLLRTRDAHGLYSRFGFMHPPEPERLMVMRNLRT